MSYINYPSSYTKASCALKKVFFDMYDYSINIRKTYVSYWNMLGYSDINDIILQIKEYGITNDKVYDYVFINDDKKINEFIIKAISDFNFNNYELRNEFVEYVFGKEVCLSYKTFFSNAKRFIVDVRGSVNSKLTIKYWISRGYDEEYARSVISDYQKKRSPRCKEYYINKGLRTVKQ